MRNMLFAVTDLKKIIHTNREHHRKIFLEAQDGYRIAMIAELDGRLREAREGRRISRMAFLSEPEDHTRDYDRILTMLEMCTEAQVELNELEFGQYVMDDWQWKRSFLVSNSAYSSTAAGLVGELDTY